MEYSMFIFGILAILIISSLVFITDPEQRAIVKWVGGILISLAVLYNWAFFCSCAYGWLGSQGDSCAMPSKKSSEPSYGTQMVPMGRSRPPHNADAPNFNPFR